MKALAEVPVPTVAVVVVEHLAAVEEYTPQAEMLPVEVASPSRPPLQDISVESIISTATDGS